MTWLWLQAVAITQITFRIFDSIDGIEGFMLGAIKAVAGMLKHNDNWENEL